MRLTGIYILLTLFILAGCKEEDEYVYPPAISEILCARTDSYGQITYLLPDKGEPLYIENTDKIAPLLPDTVYRMISIYEVKDPDKPSVHVYTIQKVLSPDPIQRESLLDGMKMDPVNVQSVWRSGDYINMILLIKAQNGGKHSFHFIENCFPTDRFEFLLYHDQGGDVEAYTQLAYLSIPLRQYKNTLSPGDEILVTINTFDEGLKRYWLTY